MVNFLEILKQNNIEINEEQKKTIEKSVLENYRTINDYQEQVQKLNLAKESIKNTENAFNEFREKHKDINPEEMKSTIDKLSNELLATKTDYENKISNMAFDNKFKETASKFNCIDIDAIKTKFDIDAIKTSNNQDSDLENAFKNAAENFQYLFAKSEPEPVSKINIGGAIGNAGIKDDNEIAMRKAIGLPIEK